MMKHELTPTVELSDAQLVAETLAGNREAFACIVERYKSLICSLAYSATGSVSESEDLAQDTFVAAWKDISALREPSRLRSWLCGIARNLIGRTIAKQQREPMSLAEPIQIAEQSPALGPLPSDILITEEEQRILWRCLSEIPSVYREPLILFYRQHRSIEQVACALDLGEDAVKQRLSRGRRLLQGRVLTFVEKGLEGTMPGKAFTVAVMGALPLYTSSAAAATLGSTVAQGTSVAKGAAWISILCASAGSLVVLLGTYVGYRASCEGASSEDERRSVKRFYQGLFGVIAGFMALSVPLMVFGKDLIKSSPRLFAVLFIGLVFTFMVCLALLSLGLHKAGRRLAQAQGQTRGGGSGAGIREFRSKLSWLGIPLVHIRIGGDLGTRREPVKAWVACGDVAYGGLFAFGGLAIAPFAIGGLSIGLLSWGGTALGLLAAGGFSLGWWSFGGCAVGWMSFGAYALGWQAAAGSVALAKEAAIGWLAYAEHFNDFAARSFVKEISFFRYGAAVLRYLAWINLVWIIPLIIWWRMERRARQAR